MNTEVMFSSKSPVWETPQPTFDALDAEFNFVLDVCAIPENAKCDDFITPEQDGLVTTWDVQGGAAWMNPPYGREIGKWVAKAYGTAQRGTTVVCLLPARTDTAWWHNYCTKGEIRFIRGRLKFGGHVNSAPFPSAVVVFKKAGTQ